MCPVFGRYFRNSFLCIHTNGSQVVLLYICKQNNYHLSIESAICINKKVIKRKQRRRDTKNGTHFTEKMLSCQFCRIKYVVITVPSILCFFLYMYQLVKQSVDSRVNVYGIQHQL